MADIKTKSTKKDIKIFDKASTVGDKMKDSFVRTKQNAENLSDEGYVTPTEYAENNIRNSVEDITKDTARGTKNIVKSAYKKGREVYRIHKDIKQAKNTVDDVRKGASKVKQTAKSAGKQRTKTLKRSVKTTQKTVKTAEKTSKAAIKTSKAAAKTAREAAKVSAKAAAQATKAATKSAIAATKIAIKATLVAVKTIIAGIKVLVTAIAAGGWIAVIIIIVICLIALIVASCFGIFASSEDIGTGITIRTAVQEINDGYNQKIERIKTDNPHDEFIMSGTKAKWKEVIAIYTVDKNMADLNPANPDESQEVVTMTASKQEDLRKIFWDINKIEHKVENKNITETQEDSMEEETEKKVLTITVSHKDIETIMNEKGFVEEQREMVYELLDEKYNTLWFDVLYGITFSDSSIVQIAAEQIGNVGGEPYWSWYGFSSRVEWCACFVSWCANECGYIDTGIVPKYSVCDEGVNWFKTKGQWIEGCEEPMPGMVVFFDWASDGLDGSSDHTGIVEKVENGRVYTIEGNSFDTCENNSYVLGYNEILGYGTPDY